MYALSYLHKFYNLKKIYKMNNNTGFVLNEKERTIKFTIIENNSFLIEDHFKKDDMVFKSYTSHLTDQIIFNEWIAFIYTDNFEN